MAHIVQEDVLNANSPKHFERMKDANAVMTVVSWLHLQFEQFEFYIPHQNMPDQN